MIVVGVNAGGTPIGNLGGRGDAQIVRAFFDDRAQLAAFDRHRGQAVGFFHAPAGDVGERGRAVGKHRHHRQRHRRIGDVVAVHLHGLQRPFSAANLQPVGAAFDIGTHGACGFHKADVALHGVETHAQHLDAVVARAARGQRAECDEVAGRRRIGLDVHHARRAITAAGGNREALPVVVLHLNAETRQQLKRDVDVGPRDQLADHLDLNIAVLGRERQGHQQRRQELARHIAAHAHRCVERQRRQARAMLDVQRRKTVVAEIVDLAAELAQCVDQVANRALVHARHAREFKLAAEQGQRRGERAHRRSGIAQKQLGRGLGRLGAKARDVHGVAVFLHVATDLAQRVEHHAGVVGGEQIADFRGALTQGGQQQNAIGNALGARELHATTGRGQGR